LPDISSLCQECKEVNKGEFCQQVERNNELWKCDGNVIVFMNHMRKKNTQIFSMKNKFVFEFS